MQLNIREMKEQAKKEACEELNNEIDWNKLENEWLEAEENNDPMNEIFEGV
jgi:hypothetical protein